MFSHAFDHNNRPIHKAYLTPHPNIDVAQRGWELMKLLQIYCSMDFQHVLELGTYQGGTLFGWLTNAKPGASVLAVDDQPINPLFETWKPDDVTYKYLQGNTHDGRTFDAVKTHMPRVDFLFIDADHTYEGVKQDFNTYGSLVKSGGIIAFHDILNPAPYRNQDHVRVSVLWHEIQHAGYVTQELICHPGQDWGGIGVVYL